LPYDADMEVPSATDFLSSAWQCKCSYETQLNALARQIFKYLICIFISNKVEIHYVLRNYAKMEKD